MSDLADLLPPRPQSGRPPRAPKPVGIAVVAVLLAALLGIAFVGGRTILSSFRSSAPDYPGPGTGSVLVQVQEGETAAAVATRLKTQDVVASEGAFRSAAAADPRSRSLQPGYYRLRSHMSGAGALALLLDPASRARSRVTLPEGVTTADALKRIADATEVPLKDLRAAVARPADLGLPSYAKGQVEGYLYPATYDIEPGTSAVATLRLMVERFDEAAAALDLEARARAIGRTPAEVITTASLIEKETAYAPDRPKVARVVYNRLHAGMPLQFDSTVNYIRTEKKARLSLDDLKVESTYNTYLNKGLPPTAIDSPGQASLEAALEPAPGDYVYFVTVAKDGSSLFTKSYDAFVAAKAKAKREGVY